MANLNTSSSLILTTPLIINKMNTHQQIIPFDLSVEYFIGVKSIKINGKSIRFNTKLLSINSKGYGGTKVSTVEWIRTVLETLIYNAVVNAFVKGLKNVTRVFPVAPFGECFSSKNTGSTHVGLAVPTIDFVLQEKNVFWRIYGANSMVKVSNEVLCLGIVDGGRSRVMTNIVIGGHQIEDNLLEFDIEESRLRFSSSLLVYSTSGAKFKFMSNA